jgi:MIP family channel proteins
MGESAYAVQVLSRNGEGNVISSNLAWGIGMFLATLMTLKVSGACLNPAVTLAYAVVGRLQMIKVIPYCIAQTIGAFCGAGLVYFLYHDAFDKFDGGWRQIEGPNATAYIFATYPKAHIENSLGMDSAIFDQVLATFALVVGYLAATDPFNGFPEHLIPFAIGLNVAANGFAFMYNAGGAINPARDLGPRIMTLCCYGTGVFSYRNHNWFWIPVVGPLVGALLAAFIYKVILAIHHPEWDNRPKEQYTRHHHTRAFVVTEGGKGTEQSLVGHAPTDELINLMEGAERAAHHRQ